MEIVLAVVICGLFGFWIWNLKSDLIDLQKRLDDENSRIVLVYAPSSQKPQSTREPAPIKKPTKGVIHDGEATWIMS
jgi:hypothetical protein